MSRHSKLQRKQLQTLAQEVSAKFAEVRHRVDMHAFGFALALVSSFVMAGGTTLPTSNGTLDRALKLAIERGAFSPWKDWILFVNTVVGTRAAQLAEVVTCAQMAGIIGFVGPDYQKGIMLLTPRTASTMLTQNGITDETATEWGETLIQALAEVF